jgi:hypothetical protein
MKKVLLKWAEIFLMAVGIGFIALIILASLFLMLISID